MSHGNWALYNIIVMMYCFPIAYKNRQELITNGSGFCVVSDHAHLYIW